MNSQGILYPEPSQDPIFPATRPYDVGSGIGVRYFRPSQRDNVLGCVDSIRWCVQDIAATWYDLSGRDLTGTYFDPDELFKEMRQTMCSTLVTINWTEVLYEF